MKQILYKDICINFCIFNICIVNFNIVFHIVIHIVIHNKIILFNFYRLSLNNFLRFFSDRCENILDNKLLSKGISIMSIMSK